ncbi:ribbon-helix-helix protein, CopG family [Rhodobaculum claviforme]|uniref:Ribbon-helix-helix protein CopG domain-containing protein n=1 Tax=Rhodobaculum claviforme TaxID=1549854 RepID=A0A934TJH0_9RHOB|nr:ribbon-helix-helix protein, CopG family [Rhodobaculum claviforme]MBK5927290.1 hypothetical protein [Rhodobaculum claviforme]
MSIKENRPGRPRADTEAVNLRLPRALIHQLDELRRQETDLPTRPEMIRRILQSWMEEHQSGGQNQP